MKIITELRECNAPMGFKALGENQQLNLESDDYSLLTDLYQLTMGTCYVGEGLEQRPASFELFMRGLPKGFGYLIAMGLAQALDYLEKFRFSASQIDALRDTGIFTHTPQAFWELLRDAHFTGDVWAVPEGTAVFAHEPLLRVEAPLWQAQLVETYLLNTINYQTLIATRAARIRDIAGTDTHLWEFGTRRAFSPQASLWAARAALAAGFDGTSNVLAALKLGRKPVGTMAHALVMALTATQGSENDAFTAFHRYFPGAPLLIDTYDTIAAARSLGQQLEKGEIKLEGVRLDSGDLVRLSQETRALLPGVPIFATSDLDEWKIAQLKEGGACIDGYGFGTRLVSGASVNGVYKLVEIDGIAVMKEASGKISYPGKKQIFRALENSQISGDCLGLITENFSERDRLSPIPLMELVMQGGKRLKPIEKLEDIALRTAANVASLPRETRSLENPISPKVEISTELQTLTQKTQKGMGNG